MKKILIFGILLRIIIFIYLSPFNNDNHILIVFHIFDTGTIPVSSQYGQSFHPPLYYVVASMLFQYGVKAIQSVSLLLSIGTLLTIYQLLRRSGLFQSKRIKRLCLLITSLLPQLVMFGNYISNDTLSYLLGALIFLNVYLYIGKPDLIRMCVLAFLAGLGLLTKGTFIAFVPVLFALIIAVQIRDRAVMKKKILFPVIFLSITLLLGSYKFIENIRHEGRPIVHNIDFNPEWVEVQKIDDAGLLPALDLNFFKLVKYPTISEHTKRSYPLLFYGTFWYQYIFESNFDGNKTPLKYLGSIIYIFSIIPTLLILIGLYRIFSGVKDSFKDNRGLFRTASLMLFLLNLALVLTAGIKYQVWSCFQSRLLFPSFFAIVLFLYSGLEYVETRFPALRKAVCIQFGVLSVSFLAYFTIEVFRVIENYGWGFFTAPPGNF